MNYFIQKTERHSEQKTDVQKLSDQHVYAFKFQTKTSRFTKKNYIK